jgi:hypothetical protein
MCAWPPNKSRKQAPVVPGFLKLKLVMRQAQAAVYCTEIKNARIPAGINICNSVALKLCQ